MIDQWFDAEKTPKREKGEEDYRLHNGDLTGRLMATVEAIMKSPEEQARRDAIKFDLELYMGEALPDLDMMGTDTARRAKTVDADHQVFNVAYSLVNTVCNRVTSFKPRAQFLPNGGNYKARRAARDMTEMSDAWAEEQDYQGEASFAFRDMLTGDGGVMKFFEEGGKIRCGRFPSWEFLVEYDDGKQREPECLYHVRKVPVAMAARSLGLNEREVTSGGEVFGEITGTMSANGTGTVMVADAWRRGPEGRHAQIVGHHVVVDEDWAYDGFPVQVDRFDYKPTGFWGIGGVFSIRSIQIELNELQVTLRESHRRTASQIISVHENESAEGIPENDYITVTKFKMQPPNIQNPAAVNPEIYKYADVLTKQAYDTWGVSQFVASGTKQPGVTSAVAIRESTELQTDRLALLSQRWERLRTQAATWWWRLTRDLAKRTGETPKWRGVTKGQWKELVFGDLAQEYEIRAYPSSIFGQSIAGRFDRATELIQAGWMTKEEAMRAMDMPDLSPVVDLALAEYYATEKIVDDILENGKFQMPPPYMDKQKVWTYARSRYLLAFSGDGEYDKGNISLLTKLIDAMAPKPAATPPAPAAPTPPGGAGGMQMPAEMQTGVPPQPAAPAPPPLPGPTAPPAQAPALPS